MSSNNSIQFHGRASDVANPVTHSALDFFERPSVLINYEGSHDQEVFPQVGCRGPQLDFIVTSDNRNLIDLNKIILDLECSIYAADGKTPAEESIPVCFTNNTLHSLFSHAEVFLNGILVSSSNNAYHHSAFVETEMTTDLDAKHTWAESQGYQYQADKSSEDSINRWKDEKMRQGKNSKNKLKLVGAPHIDLFECEKVLLPGVTLHLRLYRSSNDFCLTSLTETDEKFVPVIERASIFVTKLIVKDSVRLSIEKALLTSPANYPYIEILNKSFIIQAGQNSFIKEHLFGTEPVRRLTLCMATNEQFRGSKDTDPFHYQAFGLQRVEISRGNGVPVPGTPLDLRNGKMRAYYNTICSLGFAAGHGGNGISFKNFEDHFVLVFDLTSTREASKSLTLFPELTGGSLTLKLMFEKALDETLELFVIAERFSQIFIDSQRNITKNSLI